MTNSTKTYWSLILALAILSAVNVFLPNAFLLNQADVPISKPVLAMISFASVLVLYGGIGTLGRFLATKLGIPDLLDTSVSDRQRFQLPLLAGLACGVFFIIADIALRPLHGLGAIPHPDFPASLVASVNAAIGEEAIFRLFLIPFWVWLISAVVLKGRFQTHVFWVVAIVTSVAFAAGHLPSVLLLLGIEQLSDIPNAILFEVFLLNGVLSIAAAWLFLRYGFIAAIGIHFWTDIVWHVLFGLV
ncbi:MAG: CPBP family glutamic-type intramembrane protease [Paracoccaceae bacterium]|nr:CPBP family glutamic-type intramembrane protease [Paracoccaceae bacterium]